MGQVPKIAIIGRGRLARHFSHYFTLLGHTPISWHRGLRASLEETIAPAATVCLMISDSSLKAFYEEHPILKTKSCLHFSGALILPEIPSAHPLMTFADELYSEATYRNIPFVEEQGRPNLRKLIPWLPNPVYSVAANQKPLYHALCTLAATSTNLVWHHFLTILEQKLLLPRSVAVPFIEQLHSNAWLHGSRALTGPIQRQDDATQTLHLKALEMAELRDLYMTLCALQKVTK